MSNGKVEIMMQNRSYGFPKSKFNYLLAHGSCTLKIATVNEL